MICFVAYDDSGQITKTGVCADQDFALQGENVMEGVALSLIHI